MATTNQQPVSAEVVGNAFVEQYYNIMHQSPSLAHQFYRDNSQIGRPSGVDGSMTITTTTEAINEKILSQNYAEFTPEIKTVDSQESCNGGVHVLVTGCLTGKDNVIQNFTQTFFLATQENGFFVLNDMLRFTGNETIAQVNVEDSVETADNGVVVVKEEVSVAEAVVEVQNVSLKMVVAGSKEEAPKMSYASIVMVAKENGPAILSTPPAPRRIAPKVKEQQVKPSASAAEIPLSGSVATEDANNRENGADGYSIYIKSLPINATPALLEEEFKQFGTIKSGGIQVRSKQGFCYGFVEFETASAVEKAIQASSIIIGGRHVYIQQKLSNNTSNVSNRGGGRFQGGFRNDGPRGGRGSYYGRGGYTNTRNDTNGRNDYDNNNNNNRGGNRGHFSNRNGRNQANHSGQEAKTTSVPSVSATA